MQQKIKVNKIIEQIKSMPGAKSLEQRPEGLWATHCPSPQSHLGPLSVNLGPILPHWAFDNSQLSAYMLPQESVQMAFLREDFSPDPSNSIRFLIFFS